MSMVCFVCLFPVVPKPLKRDPPSSSGEGAPSTARRGCAPGCPERITSWGTPRNSVDYQLHAISPVNGLGACTCALSNHQSMDTGSTQRLAMRVKGFCFGCKPIPKPSKRVPTGPEKGSEKGPERVPKRIPKRVLRVTPRPGLGSKFSDRCSHIEPCTLCSVEFLKLACGSLPSSL